MDLIQVGEMDPIRLGSGDNENGQALTSHLDQMKLVDDEAQKKRDKEQKVNTTKNIAEEVTTQIIEDNEAKLKERIAQCRKIIESLKIELSEQKSIKDRQNKSSTRLNESPAKCTTSHDVPNSTPLLGSLPLTSPGMYSDCVDSKLCCDDNILEYEKQLQKYQNTLNMAHMEKKNAIRKQMLTKVYRLKLLEVENQCNIELLRVKQSLQCLEPLQMIASKWRTGADDMNDVNSYELIPRYPELSASSHIDSRIDALEKLENGCITKDDFVSPE